MPAAAAAAIFVPTSVAFEFAPSAVAAVVTRTFSFTFSLVAVRPASALTVISVRTLTS